MKANRTGFLLFSNTQISSSLKLEKLIWFLKLQVLSTSHILSKPLQLHTACTMSSFSSLHLSHLCSVIIVQHKRLHFEGNELRHALQSPNLLPKLFFMVLILRYQKTHFIFLQKSIARFATISPILLPRPI